MPGAQTGHVFISYSRKDDVVMHRVVKHLRDRGIKTWVDNERLVPGTPIWEVEIEKAIINAGAVVVLLSPDSRDSTWVRREMTYAESYKKSIFPILVAGDEQISIPIRLNSYQRIDIRTNEIVGLNRLSQTLSPYVAKDNVIQDNLDPLQKKPKRVAENKRRAKEKRETKKQVPSQVATPKAPAGQIAKAIVQTGDKGLFDRTKQSIENLIPTKFMNGVSTENIQRGVESFLARFSKLTFQSSMMIVRVFVVTYLLIDIVLTLFDFSIFDAPGREMPWYLIALQIVLALGAGFWYAFEELSASTASIQDMSNDSIWLTLACHIWGLVGFLWWGVLAVLGFISLISKFVNLNSPTALAGLLFLIAFILAIVVGVERWGPWKNGAREDLRYL